jgi:hypothetical protein
MTLMFLENKFFFLIILSQTLNKKNIFLCYLRKKGYTLFVMQNLTPKLFFYKKCIFKPLMQIQTFHLPNTKKINHP